MTVKLPSDLIVDVMQRADPARRHAAVARLRSAGVQGSEFASAVDRISPSQADAKAEPLPSLEQSKGSGSARGRSGTPSSSYHDFEKMVLRNLFETLLPDEKTGAFGGGASAGVWRSMAADQLAGVYADSGGLGIARMLQSGSAGDGPSREAQWPYFALQPITSMGTRKTT